MSRSLPAPAVCASLQATSPAECCWACKCQRSRRQTSRLRVGNSNPAPALRGACKLPGDSDLACLLHPTYQLPYTCACLMLTTAPRSLVLVPQSLACRRTSRSPRLAARRARCSRCSSAEPTTRLPSGRTCEHFKGACGGAWALARPRDSFQRLIHASLVPPGP